MSGDMQTPTPGATAFAGASISLNYCEFTFTDGAIGFGSAGKAIDKIIEEVKKYL